ncbi:MAG: amidohydrolase [Deltaproteobacteria bacterium]|nr:amidohydrolase [Deltaproteobacteria bacterium]MBW2136362.1 amidohydrolase [Deltaproteobacteria bacterium]
MRRIDFEAHFYTEDYLKALRGNRDYPRIREDKTIGGHRLWYFAEVGQPFPETLMGKLLDLGEGRLSVMDECGVDMQVLSLSAPGIEQLEPEAGMALARRSNDALAEVIKRYPGRFMGFVALNPKDPEGAADELERAVTELGFVGWNTHSNYGDSYLDDIRYRPILERAEKLAAPIYLHPTIPAIEALRAYGLSLAGPAFGFGFETAMCMLRLILGGTFDRYPRLTFILGHFGEALPFLLKRIDWGYLKSFDPGTGPGLERTPSEYLRDNVFVTTSGRFSRAAFMCTREEMGIDRILLGTDYPYEDTRESMQFVEGLPISKEEKDKIYCENARSKGLVRI